MIKQLTLIFIILLPALSFGQNKDMAKGYYTKAREAYSKKDYQKALDYLENTKKELGSTNADIIYIEVKSRYALRKVDDQIDRLVSDFLKESDATDDRRPEVSMLLIDYQELKVKLRKQEEERLLKKEKEREKAEQKRKEELRKKEERERKAKEISKLFEDDMVFVDGGSFTMGGSAGGRKHQVTISDFSIGKHEVTVAQWLAVMGELPDELKGTACHICPITWISYYDIQKFLAKLNELSGKLYRLPTEAEWEFAARGGIQSKGYKYSGSNTLSEVGWYEDNSSGQVHPVGQKKANELGIYDMSGNVYEHCLDWYAADYYNYSPAVNPRGPEISRSTRVSRGGTWRRAAVYCRVVYRSHSTPAERGSYIGFRVALTK